MSTQKWLYRKADGQVDLLDADLADEVVKREPLKFEILSDDSPKLKDAKELIKKLEEKSKEDAIVAAAPTPADRKIAQEKTGKK